MDVNFNICNSIGSEINNRCFMIAMCLDNQPRLRRLQTINKTVSVKGAIENCKKTYDVTVETNCA